MTGLDTAVIVVSYNTRELTLQAVASARKAAAGLDARVIVADNGSADGTVSAVRDADPDVTVLVNPDNPGYGAAVNRAAAAHRATYICAMNADVVLEPESLATLRRFLDANRGYGLVGPALAYPDGTPQASAKRFPTLGLALGEALGIHALAPRNRWVRRLYYADRDLARDARVDTVSGAAMLLRAEAFDAVGRFDERFRMYFEETDLCRRLHDRGHAVALCPAARAIHQHGASTRQTSVRQVEYYLSYVRYFGKHHRRAAAAILRAAVAAGTLARMAALVVKYPPIDSDRAASLREKEAACARLLRSLGSS
ncbi:MAG: glycosyltransferase family 2 protein [Candidatus Rokuibacteriota bacterium]